MAKNLVIVESPAKVKTIKKFLGSNYEVMASQGHVRDLPKSQLGIDPENDYEPKYITIRGKGELLAKFRKEVKKADKIYLATDPDREGEAISWHLLQALKLENKKVYRITFNEITKNAVKASLKEPREINMDLVDAQQTRRILDRMVGYRISPVLWAKVKRGLSAGRVQSVALRIICDREAEINAFIPKEYWNLEANVKIKGQKKPLCAKFYGKGKEKMEIASKAEMDEILSQIENGTYEIKEIKKGERMKKPPIPFTTSTLQQEAAKALNFPTQKTMRIAQQLYEGVEIKGMGTIGLITYLRTDSTRVSEEANGTCLDFIRESYGDAYAGGEQTVKKSSKKIQDAHEAIRPTNVELLPEKVKNSLSRDQLRLYQLIWRRFVASRMTAVRYETISIKIGCGDYIFTAAASKRAFDGFLSVYVEADAQKEENNALAQSITKESVITDVELAPTQHFTQPPAHYTEAALVKTMEELGIGRPSTYAPTITTIIARHYVVRENKNLYVTEMGEIVNSIMKEAFPSIVDVNFTSNVEALLDQIGEGNLDWKVVVRNFYPDLDAAVKLAEEELEKVTIADEVTEEICEKCGRNMVVKYGPYGKFLVCPGFPECRNTKSYLEKIGVSCPDCGREVVIRKTKKGRRYFGCEGYPECNFMSWQKPTSKKCPKCGSVLVEKGSKLVCIKNECGYMEKKEEKTEKGVAIS